MRTMSVSCTMYALEMEIRVHMQDPIANTKRQHTHHVCVVDNVGTENQGPNRAEEPAKFEPEDQCSEHPSNQDQQGDRQEETQEREVNTAVRWGEDQS